MLGEKVERRPQPPRALDAIGSQLLQHVIERRVSVTAQHTIYLRSEPAARFTGVEYQCSTACASED